MGHNNNRKIKKAAKTQAQINKIRSGFGTKDADLSNRFDRKLDKINKTVAQLDNQGIYVDFDTTSPEGEGKTRTTIKNTRIGPNKHGHIKSDENYDAKMAYNKNLSKGARLHYLENNIADHKGGSWMSKHSKSR